MSQLFHDTVFWVALSGYGACYPLVLLMKKYCLRPQGFFIDVVLQLMVNAGVWIAVVGVPLRLMKQVPLSVASQESYRFGLLAGLLMSVLIGAIMKKRERRTPFE